ncbi:hypothetical protein BGZ96_008055 [Linnemannia gamsii]|uniref:Nucleolus and neural progenitor protein-like N-terminal domain-containing protein n=1 Tax=Linnemannia gamsii TaxID=64522 RepID=A0ABQ7JZB5_9FUNG|nr:hypothetical protein BGZ96_008055 [Linnemannia gamsii]
MATMDPVALPLYHQRTLTPPSTATLPPGPGRPNAQLFSSLSGSSSIDRSPKTFLPRTALRNSPDHTTNFQQLLFLRDCFHKSEFWDEVAILDRMHYKNKNQHRQAGYFQRLNECRRIVARIKELNVAGLIDEFVQKFYSGRSLKSLTSKSQWDSIPYRSTVAFMMTRITGGVLLLRKLQSALYETYGAFYQLMSKTQFMAFALIAIGLCSRLSLVSKAWAKEYVDCYRLLETWIKTFPKEEARIEEVNYEAQLPDSIDSVLTASSPDIPETQLLSTPLYQSADQTAPTPAAATTSTLASDLGEVIQRKELLPFALTTDPVKSSGASLEPSSARKHKLSSRSPSLEPERNQERRQTDFAIEASDPHSNLLDELDTIFGSKSSTAASSPGSTKKKEKKALPDLDDIFKSKTKQKSKDKKTAGSGTSVSNSQSPMSSAPSTPGSGFSEKSKSSTGSKSNFDSIFDFDRGSPSSSGNRGGSGSMPASPLSGKKGDSSSKVRKDKKEIDDIFGSIKKPKKKSTVSEIDSIFGPPKKKKKAP